MEICRNLDAYCCDFWLVAMTDSSTTTFDTVIVGAGLAGLSAARVLAKSGQAVKVLEARDEVGGRTRTRYIGDQPVDLGGEMIGKSYWRIRRLARELGISIEHSGLFGHPIRWQLAGEQRISRTPPLSLNETRQLATVLWRLSRLAKRLDADRPWTSDGAAELDRLSVATWLSRQRIGGCAHALLRALVEVYLTTSLEQLALLHLLWIIRREGGFIRALDSGAGYRFSDGSQRLAVSLAEELPEAVTLNCPVTKIEQEKDQVRVSAQDGTICSARKAVVCVPLPTLDAIVFEPSLPDELQQLIKGINFGTATVVGAGAHEPLGVTHQAMLGGAVLSGGWRRGQSTVKAGVRAEMVNRTDDAIAEMANVFEMPDYESHAVDWDAEPFTGGSYLAPEPEQLTRYGSYLGQSHGNVHFAAAERSSRPDSMEGAVESGENVASELLREHSN